MTTIEQLFLKEDRRPAALLVGLCVGIICSALALILVLAGPVITFGLVFAVLAGVYVLSSLEAALIVLMMTVSLLPFATLPVKVAFTPSLIECALAGFLIVYLFQWMTGRRRDLHLVPVSWGILIFVGIVVFAFVLGLRNARPTPNQLKTFVTLVMSILMALILADVASDVKTLRRIAFILLIAGAAAGAIGVVLWL
ncbi:MAG TPA: hypothetical protein VJZ27_20600, partial [Aggregatilineales bacterium]|nr:hypothetical protein [Aggregatilineales bacterium]